MLNLAVGVIAATNAGLGLLIVIGPRGRRLFWLLWGVQAVVSALGVWLVISSGVSPAWWHAATQSAPAFMVCVVGPVGLVVAAVAKAAIRKWSAVVES
ncbi:MAG: hypothetical protein CVT66_10285 [Actinobacteria bacterium HGW-Actinobacteria-6]|nr:MAG: hypothetical protein CVT66_10285 [Actinobacteria bacterium HGW-Actinobacteria-6]